MFPGVTLVIVYPGNHELVSPNAPQKTDRSVRSFTTTVNYDAGASD